jgi:hypothetical protein
MGVGSAVSAEVVHLNSLVWEWDLLGWVVVVEVVWV